MPAFRFGKQAIVQQLLLLAATTTGDPTPASYEQPVKHVVIISQDGVNDTLTRNIFNISGWGQ